MVSDKPPNAPHHLPRKRAKPAVAGQVHADVMRHLLEQRAAAACLATQSFNWIVTFLIVPVNALSQGS